MSARVSEATVLEAVLEWATAEQLADDVGAEVNALERVAAPRDSRCATSVILERARAGAALTRACLDADRANQMTRDLALAFLAQKGRNDDA